MPVEYSKNQISCKPICFYKTTGRIRFDLNTVYSKSKVVAVRGRGVRGIAPSILNLGSRQI